jgi:hypothetical protein
MQAHHERFPASGHPAPPALADGFGHHGVRACVLVKGVAIPGLRASFYRRVGARIETVGVYGCDAGELFVAWGYVDERHCRYGDVNLRWPHCDSLIWPRLRGNLAGGVTA